MNILISKPDSLGDQLIATGYVQQLLEAFPESRIIWHVRAGMEVVADLIPEASCFDLNLQGDPVVEARRLSLLPLGQIYFLSYPLHPLNDWNENTTDHVLWWKALIGAVSWDMAISPMVNRSWLSDMTVALSRAPKRVGFKKNETYQLFTEHVAQMLEVEEPYFTKEIPSSLEESEYTQMERLFCLFLQERGDLSPDIKIDVKSAADTSDKKVALIAPGVGENLERAWPIENFLQLGEVLRGKGFRLVWIEGPGDGSTFKDFPEKFKAEHKILSTNSLHTLSSLMKKASLVICNDTAYAHLAAALNRPTVAIYGAGQEKRFFPRRGKVKVVHGVIPCRNCQWFCQFDYRACVKDIPLQSVATAAETVIDKSDFTPLRVDISPPLNEKVEISEKLREKMQQNTVTGSWESWSRLQVLHEAAYRLQNCLIERAELREKIKDLEGK
mgnify:CR=1 FL=1